MKHIINYYRYKKFGDRYLATTDHGSHCILSEAEFKRLKENNIYPELFKKLEEREIILTENNMNEVVRLISNRNIFLYAGTSLHIIVVTLRCNMNCIYCHASSKGENGGENFDMSLETAKKTVDFIFQTSSNKIMIEFQGGEPLLNWDAIKYITEYAHEKNRTKKKDMAISLITNMTCMDDEKMEYLINKNIRICTSLDGPKELHDHNRKFIGGSNYDQVVHWIKKINDEYTKRKMDRMVVGALPTLTKESLNHSKDIIEEYSRLNIRTVHMRFLSNLGVAKNAWSKISYSAEEYIRFWKESAKNIEENGNRMDERIVSLMMNKITNHFDPNYLDIRSPCGAAIGQLAYNYDGKIYSCDEGRMIGEDLFMLGNVYENKYSEVVASEKACSIINASINDQYICNECVYKPYCGVCPVCNYMDQGSIIGKIPQTDRCKIYKAQFDWVIENKIMK